MDHEEYKRKALEPIVSYIESVMASYSKEELEARIKEALPKKESEDERIRKMLIELMERWKKCAEDNNVEQDVKDASDAIAYLEKQKEQKPLSTEETALNSIAFLEQLGYTCIPPGAERKPTNSEKPKEWSEEDEENFKWFDKFFRAESIVVGGRDIPQDKYLWFKSLRPQPKQDVLPSLSEKEIICLKRALDYLRKEHNRYGGEDFTNEIVVLEWLITHPILVYSSQPYWKPSEEQMEALLELEKTYVLEHERTQETAHLYMIIKSLREQLLKLM